MKKIKNLLNSKLILMLIRIVFLCNTSVYSYASSLRVPIGDYKRPNIVLSDRNVSGMLIELGSIDDTKAIGNKASMYAIFKKLGLRFPNGQVLESDTVRRLVTSKDFLMAISQEIYNRYKGLTIGIRSSPEYSMPGRLKTETKVECTSPELIAKKLLIVAKSWNSERAREFRKAKDISDDSGFGIVIQKWIFGDKNEKSGSGVAYSVNSDVGADFSVRFGIMIPGEDIVSGKIAGQSSMELFRFNGAIYFELQNIARKLEQEKHWPQEIEFVVEDDVLYILQSRNIEFSPRGELAYINSRVKSSDMTEAQAVPFLEKIQQRIASRKVFKIKENSVVRIIGKGIASIPGAMAGRLVFSIEEAREYAKYGPVIIAATLETREEIIIKISSFPMAGFITTYGGDASHEAVLTRAAGIPAIINAQEMEIVSEGGSKVLKHKGGVVKAGDFVAIDGDANAIITSQDRNIMVENGIFLDATHGIDLEAFRKSFINSIGPNISYEKLLALNIEAQDNFLILSQEIEEKYISDSKRESRKKEAFIANIKKHYLHQLLIQKAMEIGRTEYDANKDLGLLRMFRPEQEMQAEKVALEDFLEGIKAISGSYPRPFLFYRNAALQIYKKAPYNTVAIRKFARALENLKDINQLSMYKLSVLELILRQIYKKLLAEQTQLNLVAERRKIVPGKAENNLLLINSVGKALARPDFIIKRDMQYFERSDISAADKEIYIDENQGFVLIKIRAGTEYSASLPESLDNIRDKLKSEPDVIFNICKWTEGGSHNYPKTHYDPEIIVPVESKDRILALIEPEVSQLGFSECGPKDFVGVYYRFLPHSLWSPSCYPTFYNALSQRYSRDELKKITSLGELVHERLVISTDEKLFKDNSGTSWLITAKGWHIYVHPFFFIFFESGQEAYLKYLSVPDIKLSNELPNLVINQSI